MRFEFENYYNFEKNWCQLTEEPIIRDMSMVVFRASLGHKDAIIALDKLRKLQLKVLGVKPDVLHNLNLSVDPSGKSEKIIYGFVANAIWEKARKNNPPSGYDGYAVNWTNKHQLFHARGLK